MAASEEADVVSPTRREFWRPSRCCTIASPCSGEYVAMATSNLSSCVDDCGLQKESTGRDIAPVTRCPQPRLTSELLGW